MVSLSRSFKLIGSGDIPISLILYLCSLHRFGDIVTFFAKI